VCPRTGRAWLRPAPSASGEQHLALQRADTVDEEDAIEVVDLVLQDAGEQAASFDDGALAVAIEPSTRTAAGAFDDLLQPGMLRQPSSPRSRSVAELDDRPG
jgi:hypothetical protein